MIFSAEVWPPHCSCTVVTKSEATRYRGPCPWRSCVDEEDTSPLFF